jgi:hypothetical protein
MRPWKQAFKQPSKVTLGPTVPRSGPAAASPRRAQALSTSHGPNAARAPPSRPNFQPRSDEFDAGQGQDRPQQPRSNARSRLGPKPSDQAAERVHFEPGSDDSDASSSAAQEASLEDRFEPRKRANTMPPTIRYVEPDADVKPARKTPQPSRSRLNFVVESSSSHARHLANESSHSIIAVVRDSILQGLGMAARVKEALWREEVVERPLTVVVDAALAAAASPELNIRVEWKRRQPVPGQVLDRMKRVLEAGEYAGTPTADMVAQVRGLLERASLPAMPIETLQSIRQKLLIEKAMVGHERLQKNAGEVCRRYEAGEGILDLARQFQAPPVACMREVLKKRGLSKDRVKKALRQGSLSLSEPRDREERDLACLHDSVTGVDQDTQALESGQFEKRLEAFLLQHKVAFKTQADLMRQPSVGAAGKPSLTPDFLITSSCLIGGRTVKWIDAKNYFGVGAGTEGGGLTPGPRQGTSRFMLRKTVQQTSKYVERFGAGAVVYSLGVASSHTDELGSDVAVFDFDTLVA